MATLDRQVQETFALLTERYKPFAETLPLAIGTYDQLVERHPEIGPRLIRITLTRYCARPRYLRAVARGTARFDLDGNAAGEVTEEQRAKAHVKYEEWHAKRRADIQRRWELRRQQREAIRAKKERLRKEEQKERKLGKAGVKPTHTRRPPKPAVAAPNTPPTAPAAPSPAVPKLGRPVLTLKKTKSEKGAPV